MALGLRGDRLGAKARGIHRGLFAQLLHAQPRVGGVEARRALVGQGKRPLVKLKRQLSLVQLIETDSEIEGVVGIFRIDRVGLEVRRLGFGPARLLRVLRSEEHTSELQSPCNLVCRLLLEKKKNTIHIQAPLLRETYTGLRLMSEITDVY